MIYAVTAAALCRALLSIDDAHLHELCAIALIGFTKDRKSVV